jgi:hypothetical protein
LNDNIFVGNIDNPYPDIQSVSGTMTITFLENPLRVNVVIDADFSSMPSGDWTKHYHLEINDVPGTGSGYYETGSSLSRINYIYKMNANSPAIGAYSEEYLNSSFNYESEISIDLFK